ncbi:BTB/POZ domain-containing protein KCTD9 isoform X2 [Ceratitis capitata]|uniref:BTB/POZ domain-containing protein KCTD9 isoform X2 n=1 Tax=Ceratitis capitata TaxID=7213 RepID=UPI000A0F9657|nr:BTB/POZ domain-containing protein KCTD9 isoform X2 [Ceratitis capitata]
MERLASSNYKSSVDSLPNMKSDQNVITKLALAETATDAASKFNSSKWVKLNVGGKVYVTTLCTLVSKEPDSMLARMFSQDGMLPSEQDEQGAYLIDRSAHYFEPIINYLRHGQLIVDANVSLEGVLEEARFFGIYSLISQLEPQLAQISRSLDDVPLTRKDVIKALIQTPHASELRFQGVNLAGADLRKLDFRNINFKYACMQRCNLSHANLTYCCLERTDLAYANLECSQLVSVKGLCANMEGANLRGCNFEDPTGVRTNLEGVNLKGACLESSNMAAVLAGADLERCNLSGSDLQEANLRGANLKDAELTLMVTPLHMAQAIR